MGCQNSKAGVPEPESAQPPQQRPAQTNTIIGEDEQTKPLGNVEVYGCYPSLNCMGPVMLASSSRCGKMVTTYPPQGTGTDEFLAMNPFHGVPTLKDEGLVLAESNAILRYMAERYSPHLYPKTDQKRQALIDWAMERFASTLYQDVYKTIYPCMGFAGPPTDPEAVGKIASHNLKQFADVFLTEKFIGGSNLSIADYKVAPFFFAYVHPMLREKCSIEVPERVKEFVTDFMSECPASELLHAPKGSLKELLDDKHGSKTDLHPTKREAKTAYPAVVAVRTAASKSEIEIIGIPASMNCAGALLLGKHAGIGHMKQCMPGQDTKSEDHLKKNPFGGVPVLKDGDFCLAESSAILRYMARAYAPALYPDDLARRAHIEWAIDRFSFGLYNDCVKTIYVAAGFRVPDESEDLAAVGKVASDNLVQFAQHFLKETFIGGKTLSIADFKIAPFFAAYGHTAVQRKCFVVIPERVAQFNKDFAEACTGSELLHSAGGFSIIELLDSQDKQKEDGDHRTETEAPTQQAVDVKEAMTEEATELVAGSPTPVIDPVASEPNLDDPPAPAPACGCF